MKLVAYNSALSRSSAAGAFVKRTVMAPFIALGFAVFSQYIGAQPEVTCPVTLGSDRVFAEPWPQVSTWYGSESLATILPEDGIWSTTKPGARITGKVSWWSIGSEPGQESDLTVKVDSLHGGPHGVIVDRPTNALGSSLGAPIMLTGIHFPDAGCWQITANLMGQELTFVVETIKFQ